MKSFFDFIRLLLVCDIFLQIGIWAVRWLLFWIEPVTWVVSLTVAMVLQYYVWKNEKKV